jgi:tRNA pseudouridine13 synthase
MSPDLHAPVPWWTAGLPGIGGRIKQEPEDFDVEEIPAYQPCGSGDFLYLWIEKRSMGSEYFCRQIARRLGIDPGEVGTAGLKDRHAVTRQMVSVPGRVQDRLNHLDGEGMRLLDVSRHGNKLRPGHLRGNRFGVLIRHVGAQAASHLQPILDHIHSNGLANFYGSQRFGHDGETVALGLALLRGDARASQARSRFLRKLALSAIQSSLYNAYLSQRLHDGLMRQVLAGDVMAKWPAGGMFVAQDPLVEQARFEARETVHTGPIFGRKTYAPAAQAAERELHVLSMFGFGPAVFRSFGKLLAGTRRHNVIYVDDLAASIESSGVRMIFTLPAGSYATVLLGEVMKAEVASAEEEA